jgi:hypothetical protein
MDVPNELQQVGVGIDQQRVIALLEQMSRLTMLAMNFARVLTRQPLHEPANGQIRDLYRKVNRVLRPVERMHASATANDHRSEKLLESGVIARISEDRLPRVAALDNVVQPAWDVQS